MTSIVPSESIVSKNLFFRGEKVLLDRDLADLYGVETKVLKQAVRRNIDRFPEDFMFALTRDEILRISQIVTSSDIKYAKRVHAFTEQGVAMLSSVLRSERAIKSTEIGFEVKEKGATYGRRGTKRKRKTS